MADSALIERYGFGMSDASAWDALEAGVAHGPPTWEASLKIEILLEELGERSTGLVYSERDRGFHMLGSVGGYSSAVLNDLNLEVNEDGRVIEVWGYSPRESWIDGVVQLPEGARRGALRLLQEFTPGVSRRMGGNGAWLVTFDANANVIRYALNVQEPPAVLVEFLDGCIAGLDRKHELVSLWLQPEMIP